VNDEGLKLPENKTKVESAALTHAARKMWRSACTASTGIAAANNSAKRGNWYQFSAFVRAVGLCLIWIIFKNLRDSTDKVFRKVRKASFSRICYSIRGNDVDSGCVTYYSAFSNEVKYIIIFYRTK